MKTKSITELLVKLETSHEPGLTNSQLMLTNDDLKPGKGSLLFPIFPGVLVFPLCAWRPALGMIIGRMRITSCSGCYRTAGHISGLVELRSIFLLFAHSLQASNNVIY